jgi:hypothetical protein
MKREKELQNLFVPIIGSRESLSQNTLKIPWWQKEWDA